MIDPLKDVVESSITQETNTDSPPHGGSSILGSRQPAGATISFQPTSGSPSNVKPSDAPGSPWQPEKIDPVRFILQVENVFRIAGRGLTFSGPIIYPAQDNQYRGSVIELVGSQTAVCSRVQGCEQYQVGGGNWRFATIGLLVGSYYRDGKWKELPDYQPERWVELVKTIIGY